MAASSEMIIGGSATTTAEPCQFEFMLPLFVEVCGVTADIRLVQRTLDRQAGIPTLERWERAKL